MKGFAVTLVIGILSSMFTAIIGTRAIISIIYENKTNKRGVNVTYWMNKLQKLNTSLNVFVSLNPSILPSKEKIFKEICYDHPLFDLNTFENQKKITTIQGNKNIWFCGAYLGYGFHEDGITSALHVVKRIFERNNEKN